MVLGSFPFQCSRNVKDILHGTKNDQSQVKRIVLACERDMEDFTAPQICNTCLDELPFDRRYTCETLSFLLVNFGKSSTNGPFSMATLDSQRIPVGTPHVPRQPWMQ